MEFNTRMGLIAVVLGLAWVVGVAWAKWPSILYTVGVLDIGYGIWLMSKRSPS